MRLQKLVNDFRDRGSDKFHRRYADDLDSSRSIFCTEQLVAQPDTAPYTREIGYPRCPASDAEKALTLSGTLARNIE